MFKQILDDPIDVIAFFQTCFSISDRFCRAKSSTALRFSLMALPHEYDWMGQRLCFCILGRRQIILKGERGEVNNELSGFLLFVCHAVKYRQHDFK